MKQFLLGSLCTLFIAVVGGLVYMRLGLAEVRGDAPASRLESSVMQMAVHASVRRQAPNIPNPIAATDENLIAGAKIYLNECAGCHGTPGKNPMSRIRLTRPRRACRRWAPVIRRHRFSGWQSMAFGEAACLRMACGIRIKSCGQ